ncbi:dynamin family protein [Shewanella colwelliana]|uniref:dynamin family protein n=1 Tax=Shewanella colwelliana TaxID=23 RepID=UPI00048B175E|nr:dynamin family protein [Shewanella colwelliana]
MTVPHRFDFHSQSFFIDLIGKAESLNAALNISDSTAREMEYLSAKLADFKVMVPVVGKFSGGKSTLLNTHMRNSVLKHDITPETAFATELHYSETEKLLVHYLDDTPVAELPADALGTLQGRDNLFYVQLFLNNDALKCHPNVVLVDMPGFDSKSQAHHKAIANYLARGDLFVCLFPAGVSFDGSIIDSIAEIKLDHGKDVLCLLSKSGRQTAAALNESKASLVETLARTTGSRISIGHIEAVDKKRFTLDDFDGGLADIGLRFDELLSKRFTTQLDASLDKLVHELQSMQRYSQSNEAQLRQQIGVAEQAYSQAREELNHSLTQLEYNLCSLGKEQLISQVSMVLNTATDRLLGAAKANQLSSEIAEILRPVLQSGIKSLIQAEVGKLEKQLDSISCTDYQGLQISVSLAAEQKDELDDLIPIIIATLGPLILSRLGPVGLIISNLLAQIFGAKPAQQQDQQAMLQQKIQSEVIPQAINHAIEHIKAQLEKAAAQLKDQVMDSFEQNKHAHQQKLHSLQQQLNEDKAKFDRLQADYADGLQQVQQLRQLLIPVALEENR